MHAAPSDARSTPAESCQRIVVLLVDDQAFTGSVVGFLLESEKDIELHCCLSALDAVAKGNEIVPTVILQDLVMPDIDGLTLLRSYRANPLTAGTPVIVLSGNDDAATRTRALSEGADGYLVKIPPKAALIDCIRHHASRSAAGRETLDLTVIERLREAGAPEFALRLVDQFLQQGRARTETLREAAGRQDVAAMSATAHALKDTAMMVGASRLTALCARVEDQATLPPAGDIAPALIVEIDEEFVRVEHALAAQRERIGHP